MLHNELAEHLARKVKITGEYALNKPGRQVTEHDKTCEVSQKDQTRALRLYKNKALLNCVDIQLLPCLL